MSAPLTVTHLARTRRLSRGTLLYYESIGLLLRPRRTPANYRACSATEVERLRRICVHRDAGVPLRDIRALLDGPRGRPARSCAAGSWSWAPRPSDFESSSARSRVCCRAPIS